MPKRLRYDTCSSESESEDSELSNESEESDMEDCERLCVYTAQAGESTLIMTPPPGLGKHDRDAYCFMSAMLFINNGAREAVTQLITVPCIIRSGDMTSKRIGRVDDTSARSSADIFEAIDFTKLCDRTKETGVYKRYIEMIK